ncbi:MAG: hypothetical protein HS116_20305 [Planctomycetes bacterium]|nr:hypothetical protein [Planctomycetota bacterium]
MEAPHREAHPPAAGSQGQIRRDLAFLEAMLNEGAHPPAVRMKMRDIETLGATYPPGLRERAGAYLRNYEWRQQRKRTALRIGGSVAACAILVAVAGAIYYELAHKDRESSTASPGDSAAPKPAIPRQPEVPAAAETPDAPPDDATRQAWNEEWPRVRALLPDLDGYVKGLIGLRPRFAAMAAVRDVDRWLARVPAYARAIEYGKRMAVFNERRPGGPFDGEGEACRAFQELVAGDELFFGGVGPYAEALRPQVARALLRRKGGPVLKQLTEQLKGDLMTRLREAVVEVPGGPRTVYYTLEGEAIQRSASGAASLQVLQTKALQMGLQVFPDRAKVSLRIPAHVTLARDLAEALDREIAQPEWESRIPGMIRRVLVQTDADPYVRAVLLAELVDLDEQSFHLVETPRAIHEALIKLCALQTPFWLSGDPEVARQLSAIRTELERCTPALVKLLDACAGRSALRKACVAGLHRPLVLSAVAELSPQGPLEPTPIQGAAVYSEYWTVEHRGEGFVFRVAAVRDELGSVRWLESERVHPGQPLLSPMDGKRTRSILGEYLSLEPQQSIPEPFPINTGTAR